MKKMFLHYFITNNNSIEVYAIFKKSIIETYIQKYIIRIGMNVNFLR